MKKNTVADTRQQAIDVWNARACPTAADLFNRCYQCYQPAGEWGRGFNPPPVELRMLQIVCKITEALRGFQQCGIKDTHLPDRELAEVQLADAVIRIADLCGSLGYDLTGAIVDKIDYDLSRKDHSTAVGESPDGKEY